MPLAVQIGRAAAPGGPGNFVRDQRIRGSFSGASCVSGMHQTAILRMSDIGEIPLLWLRDTLSAYFRHPGPARRESSAREWQRPSARDNSAIIPADTPSCRLRTSGLEHTRLIFSRDYFVPIEINESHGTF
jgi:hypothetical protein